MLSILIPTYNYNVVTLVSTLHKQATKLNIPFEILVLDDCSNRIECIQKNKTIENLPNCFSFNNSKNLGRTQTRQNLAKKAKYDWLLFLDADVLPKYNDFISRFDFLKYKNQNVIYGGVCYFDEKPDGSKMLRWKYGNHREAKSVTKRLKEPYFIISQNLMIKKEIFLKLNSNKANDYGLDILFSNNLKKNNIGVKHIDNPVYHLGLEENIVFIKKSLAAVKTTYLLEKQGQLGNDLRPLQKSYLKLKRYKLTAIFYFLIKKLKNRMEYNFNSSNPNLFWFDLYRLQYYIELKSKKNA